MQSLKKKDLLFRKLFLKHEQRKKIYKFLFINLLTNNEKMKNSSYVRNFFLTNKKFRKCMSKTKIKNRCALSNRNGGVLKVFSISRILMREYLQQGIIPGFTKAVW